MSFVENTLRTTSSTGDTGAFSIFTPVKPLGVCPCQSGCQGKCTQVSSLCINAIGELLTLSLQRFVPLDARDTTGMSSAVPPPSSHSAVCALRARNVNHRAPDGPARGRRSEEATAGPWNHHARVHKALNHSNRPLRASPRSPGRVNEWRIPLACGLSENELLEFRESGVKIGELDSAK